MSTNPPPYYPGPGVQKKTSPLVWILAILGVFVVLVIVAVVGIGFFVAHKAKEAGLDSDMVKRNPALATIKVMAALNPNIEIVSLDEDKGFVTVHDRKSGRTFKVDFDDAKRGRFTVQEEGKGPVTVTTSGDDKNGTVEVNTPDAHMKVGGHAATFPVWVPDYPHSDAQAVFSGNTGSNESGMFAFKTKDSASKVMDFYDDKFKSEGMKIDHRVPNVLAAKHGQNSAVVLVGADEGETSVSVTFGSKK
jgi:uncharacterized protein YneF (UPF0154 family)